jgi:BirA family transcriptional regulator, biotin operon repressor / biotin---[acetyl-CoA-carboxylase] ligase
MAEIIRFAELDSTNDEVSRRALDGAPDGLWVMADRQHKGRGRRGRAWQSAANGNLYCSGLARIVPGEPPVQQLSFVAALVVHEVLSAYAPGIKLKWPNDVMAEGRKLSGILLESGGTGSGGLWLVVGIGINLCAHPEDSERPATNMQALTGAVLDSEAVLHALAAAFAQWRLRWRKGGFAAIKSAWLAACTGLGAPLVARLGHETIEGVFAGLGDDGALQLLLESGDIRSIHAGEVFGI